MRSLAFLIVLAGWTDANEGSPGAAGDAVPAVDGAATARVEGSQVIESDEGAAHLRFVHPAGARPATGRSILFLPSATYSTAPN